ncbi:unnamed protein product, partial [marine sediment metagenome]
MIFPLLWMISTSLKTSGDVFAKPGLIPDPVVFDNYLEIWKVIEVDVYLFGIFHITSGFLMFFINSFFVAACVTVGKVFTSSLAAYAFARLKFPGRDQLFFAYLATLMIPGTITMIPVFVLFTKMPEYHLGQWMNTYQGMIVPQMFTAMGTFLLRQFFMSLPRDLEDAARIDGCGLFGTYFRIILPLSKPALATLATMVFVGTWAAFMWPLIVVTDVELQTIPIGLAHFQSYHSTDWALLMAAAVVA